ncbi:MAG: FAD-dependent oxidoreductase [Haliscomenobacteraceae bacterium CHB4]|nr:FAD-dependent oxidoreductase [Haliscomenobacteraceae bacterium CHB4]
MKIVILGNGIAGITAARHVRKRSDHDITVVSDESDHFFSRTALMYVYMGHMRFRDIKPYEDWFWDKNRINLLSNRVERIDFQEKKLYFAPRDHMPGENTGRGGVEASEPLSYDKLLLATGSKPNKFGWPGQDLDGVHGLYHLQDLEAMERHSAFMLNGQPITNNQQPATKRAVIVGGGLIGIEMAEMFHSRNIPVTFLVRESDFWNVVLPPEEARMVSRHLRGHHIDLRLETELKEILPDDSGKKCTAVVTNKGEKIDCGFVGLTAGVSPNVDFLRNTELEISRGILVNEFLETNIPNVYAAGDCAELRQPLPGRKPIEAVWYTGRMMGETAAHNLISDFGLGIADWHNPQSPIRNPQSYTPGIWFNSAKFFDIEYQVYGDIRPHLPEGHATLYWEHPDGKKSIRLNYEKSGGRITGFNLMGVRYRQEVCDKWIRTGTHVEEVLHRLGMANFDPEFCPQHEKELIRVYNRQTGRHLKLRQKRGLDAVLDFLR